jgi:predicted RNA-binding Zn-ribbon protein involved in translation (DUF1610 family)
MNWLKKEVKNPEFWNIPRICPNCGWKRQPNDSLKIINLFFTIKGCPKCSHRLEHAKRTCPVCHKTFPLFRMPKTRRQAFWGDWTCKNCGSENDRWNRKISI